MIELSKGKTREELIQAYRFRDQMTEAYNAITTRPNCGGLSESARKALARLSSHMLDEHGLPIHISSLLED